MDTNHPTYNKIDNTFNRVMNEIDKFEKVFKQGGSLEQAVMDIDGDPSYLKDVARALSNLYDALEDAHFGTIGHVVDDRGAKDDVHPAHQESVQKNKKAIKEGVLDSDDEDGFMARSQLYFMARDAIKLHSVIQDQDDLEPWVQDKIASSSKDMDAVRRYTEYNAMKSEVEPEGMELSTHTHDEPVEEIPAEVPAEVAIETDVVEADYARDYVKAHAHDRMKDLHPVSRNAFLVDLEKTYPGIRKELGEDVVEHDWDVYDEDGNFLQQVMDEGSEKSAIAFYNNHLANDTPGEDWAVSAKISESKEVKESMEFDDKNANDDLQVVAKDLFKSAMKAAQKKHKESKVLEGVTLSGGVPIAVVQKAAAKSPQYVKIAQAAMAHSAADSKAAKADAQNKASDAKLIKKAGGTGSTVSDTPKSTPQPKPTKPIVKVVKKITKKINKKPKKVKHKKLATGGGNLEGSKSVTMPEEVKV